MQKVKIRRDISGVEKGKIYATKFSKDSEVVIDDDLVKSFLDLGACEVLKKIEEPKEPEDTPRKNVIDNVVDKITRRRRRKK